MIVYTYSPKGGRLWNKTIKTALKKLLIILCPNNTSSRIFEQIAFEQIAVIPHKVGETPKLYAILKPIDKIEGVAPDEAIVFYIDDSGEGEASLIVETDEKIAVEVFDKYYQLLDEAIGEAEKDSKMTRLLKRLDKKRKWNKE